MKVNYKDNCCKSLDLIISTGSDPIGLETILSADRIGVPSILDLGNVSNVVLAGSLINRLFLAKTCHAGIRLQISDVDILSRLAFKKSDFQPEFIILSNPLGIDSKTIDFAKEISDKVILEIYSIKEAEHIQEAGINGIIIRGNEAGGLCGYESNSILLEKIKKIISLPIWIQGGIAPESALAYYLGGAAGVIITDSILLARESMGRLQPKDIRSIKAAMRTIALGPSSGPMIRLATSHGRLVKEIERTFSNIESQDTDESGKQQQWVEFCNEITGQYRGTPGYFIGEESYLAGKFASENLTISGILGFFTKRINEDKEFLKGSYPFKSGNSFARDFNIEFPIFQGPMANVSDNAGFLESVAKNGALPFAALSLATGEVLRDFLKETDAKLGEKPWGVGLLGFAPKKLWDEQLQLIKRYSPSFAVIAGGRPSQYKTLTGLGITSFLHIPSPSMLKGYFDDGVRHFIFEGHGSGGHVGPINSFPLWQAMISELTGIFKEQDGDLKGTYVILAGGIGDKNTAAMAAAFAPPLLKMGVKVGFIMGTAYLFTKEIVDSGAVVSNFQSTAIDGTRTVVLESGGGHAIRCAPTPAADSFSSSKAAMIASGRDLNEVRQILDNNNIGRLRAATRGLSGPYSTYEEMDKCVELSQNEQYDTGIFMVGEVAGLLKNPCSIKELHKTVCDDAALVIEARLAEPEVKSEETVFTAAGKYKSTDIAIIGLSAIVPGSQELDVLWHNILAELCFIKDIPKDRWNIQTNFDSDPRAKDRIYSSKGGFIDDVPFNSMEFGIPPKAVSSIEPAQLLALEAVKRAIADAGYESRPFDRERTSVIFGTSGGGGDLALAYSVRAVLREYLHRAEDIPEKVRAGIIESLFEILPEWTEDTFPGLLNNVISGRISNQFNLMGLNFSVDAACASSLAACQVACQELSYGITKMAIVGGVDTSQHPFGYTCFSKTMALSEKGSSAPFDKDSDGIILSEGVGVVVLKRLNNAIADGDRIYSVIKGIGGASDGKGRCLTVPDSRGQVMAVNRAYEIADYDSSTLQLLEAHGTGTSLGDRTELESMQKVITKSGNQEACLAVGSIKSTFGHAKAAAGVLGLIKAALALYYKVYPATINVKQVNPAAVSDKSSIYINTATRPWISAMKHPRRAGVNAFGFGGTNFHVAMEEFSGISSEPVRFPRSLCSDELFFISGRSDDDILKKLDILLNSVKQNREKPFSQMALQYFDNWKSDNEYPSGTRVAALCSTRQQLEKQLVSAKRVIIDEDSSSVLPGLFINTKAEKADGTLALLFSGQGSQLPNMLSDLSIIFPVVRETFEIANTVLSGKLDKPLSDYIFPPPSVDNRMKEASMQAITNTLIAQPALAAVEMAICKLLLHFGIKADFAAGHSFGELTALWAAGVFSEETLIRLAHTRGKLMANSSLGVKTGMTAVKADAETVSRLIEGIENLNIANFNAPLQIVVSGSEASLVYFEERLRDDNRWFRRLQVSNAFHSPFMKEAAEKWYVALGKEKFFQPDIPVFSNTTAAMHDSSPDKIIETLSRHLTCGVRFADEIVSMNKAGAFTFLEAGPGTVLTGLVDSILENTPHDTISIQPNGAGYSAFCAALAKLWIGGHNVDLTYAFQARKVEEMPLEIKPSPTIFLVNGARAQSSLEKSVSFTKDKKTVSSTWDFLKEAKPVNIPRSLPADKMETFKPVVSMVQGKQSMDSNKLAFLSHIQDSMDVFMKSQERLQKERKQMMEQMWEMNRSLLQTVAGSTSSSAQLYPSTEGLLENESHNIIPSYPREVEAANDYKEPISVPVPEKQKKIEAGMPIINIRSLLLEVVSDRTAYPVDMLGMDQHLEADLGIDSIKRVEIIGSLKEKEPGLAEITDEKYYEEIAQLRTMGEIVHWIESKFDTGVAMGNDSIAEDEIVSAGGGGKLPDIKSLLLEVVSDRTAYPVDMLGMDQHLEADLGIDSIKRVEIIGSLKEKEPGLAEITDEKYYEEIAQLRTMGEIVHWIESKFKAGAHGEDALPPVQDGKEEKKVLINRYVLDLIDHPAEDTELFVPKYPMLILNNGHNLGNVLHESMNKKGINALLVRKNEKTGANIGQGIYSADFSSEKGISACYEKIRGEHGEISGILNLLGLGIENHEDGIACVKETFLWAKIAGSDFFKKENHDSFWMTVTGMGGDFGLSEVSSFVPSQNGVHGITKTLSYEWPGTRFKTIDFDPEDDVENMIKAMMIEVGDEHDGVKEVCWLNGKRRAIALKMEKINDAGGPLLSEISKDSVILLTGGAKGITADAAIHLAGKYSPILILASRSVLPERTDADLKEFLNMASMGEKDSKGLKLKLIQQLKDQGAAVTPVFVNKQFEQIMQEYQMRTNIKTMEDLGAKVFYFSTDCTDEEAFSGLIRKIYKKWGKIDGVIHGAGVIKDSMIADKDEESFMQVINTKVKGAEILSRELDPETLSFLVFFSSVSGRFGNLGQADYSAANEILNKIAVKLDRSWPARVVAINWGPWDGEGMVSNHVRDQFEKRGISLIPRDTGVKMLEQEISCKNGKGHPEVVAVGVTKESAGLAHNMTQIEDTGVEKDFSYTFELDPAKHAFLDDHRIEGEPVLPAAVAMEIMAQAAMAAAPGYRFAGYKDFRLFKGIVLKGDALLDLNVTSRRIDVPGGPSAELESIISMPNNTGYNINYRATILLGAGGSCPELGFARLNGTKPFSLSVQEAYNTRLFHEGIFCNIKSIDGMEFGDVKKRGVKGVIKPSSPNMLIKGINADGWLIDPVVFDCAYQMALLWTQEACNMMALPSDIDQYVCHRPYDGSEVFCEVHVNRLDIPKMNMDFIFLDKKGSVFAEALNVSVVLSADLNKRVLADLMNEKEANIGRMVG